jgi:hypothetical protein
VDQEIYEFSRRKAEQQRWRLLRLSPLFLVFIGIGIWMASRGEVLAWPLMLFFGAGLLIMPLTVARSFRRPRYLGGRFEARRVPLDTAIAAIGSAMMGAGGLWMAWVASPDARTVLLAGGGLFFLLVASLKVLELADSRPIITIDQTGYFDRRAMFHPIPWTAAERLDQQSYRGNSWFALVATGQDKNARLMTRLGTAMGSGGFSLQVNGLDCTQADLLAAVDAWAPRLTATAGLKGGAATG